MEITRREFLKLSGASMAGMTVVGPLPGLPGSSDKPSAIHKEIGKATTICPFCGCGCGFLVASENGRLVNIEGDSEHPINAGGACAKGASQFQLGAQNPRRLSNVMYRAPKSSRWEEKSWDWAIDQIASRIKATRDSTWVKTDQNGFTVNRTEGIASLGGAALNNEECYLLVKLMRALGLVYIEHQARI